MAGADVLDRLYSVIEERRRQRPEGSYVVQLLDGGVPAIAAKIREEAEELIVAAGAPDARHSAEEAADLLFHVIALLGHIEIPPGEVFEILEARFGIGGLVEKAAREPEGRDEG
jgi:phosphoribosyl-ATP pyrophosphohydrolase